MAEMARYIAGDFRLGASAAQKGKKKEIRGPGTSNRDCEKSALD